MKFYTLLFAGVFAGVFALTACGSPQTTSNQPTAGMSGSNSSSLSVEKSDVQVYAAAGDPTSRDTRVVGPVLWQPNSSIGTTIQAPISVVYALKDNERTQRIRDAGAVVYVEATPFLIMHRLLPDGTRDTRELGADIEEYRYGCAKRSRMVALAPANNYRYEYVTDQEIFIRTRGVAGYPDREITGIDAGGRVDQASLRVITTKFRDTCYVRSTQSYFGR